jgi:hypothetical protein
MRGAVLAVSFGAVLAAAIVGACKSNDNPASCNAGDRVVCSCPSGGTGLKACVNGAFGACECAPSPVDSGGGSSGGGGGDGGKPNTADAGFGQYLGACNTTADCPDGGECFPFGTKGNTCTHTCVASSECEPPSPKCNPRGVCAPPD